MHALGACEGASLGCDEGGESEEGVDELDALMTASLGHVLLPLTI